MALDASNAEVAVTGAVMVGDLDATAPTSVDGATTGFTDLGYISEDGVTESHDESTDKIKGWQNGAVVRTVNTDGSLTFQFTLLETTTAGVELAYETTVTSGAYVINLGQTREHKSFLITTIDGDELEKVYIADGQVTEVGDVVRVNTGIKAYPITIEAFADATYGQAKVWSTRLGATTS
jgi:hypothetical protein